MKNGRTEREGKNCIVTKEQVTVSQALIFSFIFLTTVERKHFKISK
jgi:hypothetical protein